MNKDHLAVATHTVGAMGLIGLACAVTGFVVLAWPGLMWLLSFLWKCLIFWFAIEPGSWWVAINMMVVGSSMLVGAYIIDMHIFKLSSRYEQACALFMSTHKIWHHYARGVGKPPRKGYKVK